MAGTLRITGGKLVRQRFSVPEEADKHLVRPTSDRVREAIFSSLGTHLDSAKVLDLFAGSGAYGFESISRGAESVLFIEKSRQTANCIRANIKKLKLESACKVLEKDACHPGLEPGSSHQFDIIFVDPPYPVKLPDPFWANLVPHLASDGIAIFRCAKKQDFNCPTGYQIIREKTYGGTWVAFLSKES